MELRPYQTTARKAVFQQWSEGIKSTLLIMPTGTGKTIVFASIIEQAVREGGRCLVLAHRHELLQQAVDKLARATGLGCGVEKAEETAVDSWFNVVVGSVQTMQNESRRTGHDFDHIIVDEAHHATSPSYRAVLNHFPDAKVLGVTATADRGDKRNLGEVFETVAYEYTLPKAIREGYLCKLSALTIPLKIDLSGVAMQSGDYALSGLDDKLGPYLNQIAREIRQHCTDRKTIVFLPLVATSQRFMELLRGNGVECREVNGESRDRAETIAWFKGAGKGAVLCNAMLLTEGYDQPDVDCICVLRPTKVRSLYCQMVGRGTRIHPGKENLLILDFLWHSERHELCRPAHLVCENQDISQRVAEILAEEASGKTLDLMEEITGAEGTAAKEREDALAKILEEQKHRKRQLVDPLQYEMSIGAQVNNYEQDTSDLRAMGPASKAQLKRLEDAGIYPEEVTCQGHASRLLDAVAKRRMENLTTPKQIRCLEKFGFQQVGTWSFDQAKKLIDRVAGNGWRIPPYIKPREYSPEGTVQI